MAWRMSGGPGSVRLGGVAGAGAFRVFGGFGGLDVRRRLRRFRRAIDRRLGNLQRAYFRHAKQIGAGQPNGGIAIRSTRHQRRIRRSDPPGLCSIQLKLSTQPGHACAQITQ